MAIAWVCILLYTLSCRAIVPHDSSARNRFCILQIDRFNNGVSSLKQAKLSQTRFALSSLLIHRREHVRHHDTYCIWLYWVPWPSDNLLHEVSSLFTQSFSFNNVSIVVCAWIWHFPHIRVHYIVAPHSSTNTTFELMYYAG